MYIYFVMYTSGTDTKLAAFYFHEKYYQIQLRKREKDKKTLSMYI